MATRRKRKDTTTTTRRSASGHHVKLSQLSGLGRRATRDALASELLSVCVRGLKAYGLGPRDILTLVRGTAKRGSRVGISTKVLEATQQLSDLIAKWSDDPAYLDSSGKPAVLRVSGSEYAFTTLANEFFPRSNIREVLRFACETKAIERVGIDRVARLNDFVVFTGNSLLILAYAVRTVRRYLSTANFNRQRRVADSLHLGRADRTSASIVSESDIAEFMRDMRLQLSDMVEGSTRWLVRRAAKPQTRRSRKRTVGMQAFLFVE